MVGWVREGGMGLTVGWDGVAGVGGIFGLEGVEVDVAGYAVVGLAG